MSMTAEVDMPKSKGRGGARPGAGRPKTDRDDISVKVDRTIAARARYVAELRNITLAEYLSEALRPIVGRDFDKANKGE